MPKVSFYLRNEDLDKWKAIITKTQWIHDSLADVRPAHTSPAKPAVISTPPIIKAPPRAPTTVKHSELCKKHGLPVLLGRSVCGMKDCH